MKHLLYILLCLQLFLACEKSEIESETGDVAPNFSISIDIEDDALTRGTVVDSEADMNSVGMYCAYTNDDSWSSSLTFAVDEASTKMSNSCFDFNSTESVWEWKTENNGGATQPTWGHDAITDKYTFFAYSPHSADAATDAIKPSIVDGVLQIEYTTPTNCTDQKDLLVATPRKDIHPQYKGEVSMDFKHKLAKISFSVKGDGSKILKSIKINNIISAGTYSTATDAWTPTTTKETFEAKINTALTPNETAQNVTLTDGYLFMLPQTIAKGSEFTLTTTDVDGTGEKDYIVYMHNEQVWEAGKSYNYTVEIGSFIHEIYPDVANCYMVTPTTTGEIKIPINEYISYFWKEYGADATEKSYANIGKSGGLKKEDLEAVIIWHDNGELDPIKNLNIVDIAATEKGSTTRENPLDSYPNYTTHSTTMAMKFNLANSVEKANAVIGVRKNNSTEYLWSWHIWITDYSPYTKTSGTTHTTSNGIEWMDRNLGAFGANYEGHGSPDGATIGKGGVAYQWGRKDPLLPTQTLAENTAENLAYAVKHPNAIYKGSTTSSDWCGSDTEWDEDRGHHWRDRALYTRYDKYGTLDERKSIFDPSPLGWMIPCSKSGSSHDLPWKFSLGAVWVATEKGIKDGDIYYPATSRSFPSTGVYNLGGSQGFYWCASPSSSKNGYILYFYLKEDGTLFINTTNNNRSKALGAAIRSVKEYYSY